MNALRGVLIGYGVAAFLFFQSKALPPGWSLVMLAAGEGLQPALFALGTFKGMAAQVSEL